MSTKITIIHDNPRDPEAFEATHPDQLALARKLSGLLQVGTSRVLPKEDGSPSAAPHHAQSTAGATTP